LASVLLCVSFGDGWLDVRRKGCCLPYRVFDEDQRVTYARTLQQLAVVMLGALVDEPVHLAGRRSS